MSFENVTKISYKNETFNLDGDSAETVLEILGVDTSTVNLEVEGETLYIVAKSGTKGAESLMDALAAFGIVPEVHVVQVDEEPETAKEPVRKRVEFKNGKLVEVKVFDEASLEDKIRQYRASKVQPAVDTKEDTKEKILTLLAELTTLVSDL